MELASVVIPVYNGESYIDRAIRSALGQTYENKEIIVVDDASTDGTDRKIFDNFADLIGETVIYIRNEENRERAYSRNRGCEAARGEFVFFLDYDDEWQPDYVKQTMSLFSSEGCDIIYSFQRTFIDEHGGVLRVSGKDFGEDQARCIFNSSVGYPTGTAFRKGSFPGYRDEYIPREDWEIFIRSYLQGSSILLVDNNMIRVRAHRQRTSSRPFFWSSTLRVYRDYIDRVPPDYRPDFIFHAGDVCLRFGDIARGWQLVIRSFLERPSQLLEPRKVAAFLKRGVRLDKFLRLRDERIKLKKETGI